MAEVSEPFLKYKNARSEVLNRTSFNMYAKMITNRFNNNAQTAQYLRMARTFINNPHFVQAFNEVVNNLQFPSKTNQQMFIAQYQAALVKNAEEYQALTTEIKHSLQSIISVLGATGLDTIVPGSDAHKALVQLFDGDTAQVDRIITLKEHEDLENTFKGQYASMVSKLPDFVGILQSPGSDVEKSFKLLARMLMPIQTLIGICSEYQAEYELNKILKDLEKDLRSSGIKVTRVGDESDSGFRIGTADLAVNLGNNANVTFSLPSLGMSLKRSHKNVNTAKEINIKLKGSTYGGLMQAIDPKLVTAFYTIYANTRPVVNGKQQSQLPAGALTSAYAQMKARMFVTALVGGADSDNLVFVMVINNKPFTIFDLLARLKEETYADEATVLLKPSFRTMRGGVKLKEGTKKATKKQMEMASGVIGMHQEYYNKYSPAQKELRSNSIRNFIDSISASMEMKVTQKLLGAI